MWLLRVTGNRGLQQPGMSNLLTAIYNVLLGKYGPQRWWPSSTGSPWEIMLGAVLTQRTSWTNVELSLGNMAALWGPESLAEPKVVLDAPDNTLAAVLRPSGFHSSKPKTLKGLAGYVANKGGTVALANSVETTGVLRSELLSIWGVGPETADAILLYALGRPVFVADAYAQRLAARWGLLKPTATYNEIQALYMDNLPHDATLFNEYHALLVAHGKDLCRPRAKCEICPLNQPVRVGDSGLEWICPRLYTISRK